jgi:hypothetical protein
VCVCVCVRACARKACKNKQDFAEKNKVFAKIAELLQC